MPIQSMTGFARATGQHGEWAWTWEAKSVNGKGRDVRSRLPPGFDSLDLPARERAGARFQRGNINLTLNLTRGAAGAGVTVNRAVLDQVLALAAEVERRHPTARPPSVDGLLSLRGVLEPLAEQPDEAARAALEEALLAGLDEALSALAKTRRGEGARLLPVLAAQLDAIVALVAEAEALAATRPEALRARLAELVAELLAAQPALPEDRLAQEAALLVAKADVREELDRLKAHVAAARALLADGEAVGRRLDFLCQELNREANTLCSKSADVDLTRLGLSLKATVEQFREQVQNIE